MRKQPGVKNDRPNYSTGTFLHIQLMVSGFKVLSEIGRFLVALIFLLLTFGSAISVLEHPYFETRLGNIFNIYICTVCMFYFLQDAVFLAVADFFNDVIYIYISFGVGQGNA